MSERPDIDAIEARANAATAAPWEYATGSETGYAEMLNIPSWDAISIDIREQDAAFIAHARTDIPALIAYVRELEAEIAASTEHLNGLVHHDLEHIEALRERAEKAEARVRELEARVPGIGA